MDIRFHKPRYPRLAILAIGLMVLGVASFYWGVPRAQPKGLGPNAVNPELTARVAKIAKKGGFALFATGFVLVGFANSKFRVRREDESQPESSPDG